MICWIQQQGAGQPALGRCWGDVEVRKGGSDWPAAAPLCEGHAGRICDQCNQGVQYTWANGVRSDHPCTTCAGKVHMGGYRDSIHDGYDWNAAFEVACRDGITAVQGATCKTDSFSPEDVAQTYYSDEGQNDGADWLWVGLLKDGRWAFVSAWCDYTGWG